MKRSSIIEVVALGLLSAALTLPAFGADEAKPTPITITGEGKCGKCALHETAKCQNVIQVEKDGKTTTYYLAQNDVSKDFHENLCKTSEKVTATGTVEMKDGKEVMTVSKIEAAK
jgi:hypothetical protein